MGTPSRVSIQIKESDHITRADLGHCPLSVRVACLLGERLAQREVFKASLFRKPKIISKLCCLEISELQSQISVQIRPLC